MTHYQALSLSAQTAYAQLLDAAQAAELMRTVASLHGSFASKQVKGRSYWYFQYTELSGRLRQIYVGPDAERVRRLIAEQRQGGPTAKLEPLARAAEALGCEPLLPAHFRVIRRLAEYGFFRAGGVLVGTHAFLAHGNMLGVQWGGAARTQDVDLAHAGKNLAVALPANLEIDAHNAIDSLEMGLLPVVDIAGRAGGSYLNPRDPEFQLDFLTPLHRGGKKPYEHPQLKLTLQPVKFLEYLLEDVQQAALFCADEVVVANVPNPARYALHKLLVWSERGAARATKAAKDLQQSAALLSWYRASSTSQVTEAWQDLTERGAGWRTRAERGRNALARLVPELDVSSWLTLPGKTGAKGSSRVNA